MWSFRTASAHDGLEPFARSYCEFEENAGRRVRRLEAVKPRVTLILGLGESLTVAAKGVLARTEQNAFIVGLGSPPLIVEHAGRQHCIEVDLAPWAGRAIFGLKMDSASSRPIALEDLWGREANLLLEHLAEIDGPLAEFARLDAVFAARLGGWAATEHREIRWAWDVMATYAGQVAIRSLSDAIGWSPRYFAARFKAEIGVTPKGAAQRLRFARAESLVFETKRSLCEIASECGYSDQSHMTRAFASFAACSPAAYREARFSDRPGVAG